MNVETFFSLLALLISIISAVFVFWQIHQQGNTTKAQLFTSIIDQIHQDEELQLMHAHIYQKDLHAQKQDTTGKTRVLIADGSDITELLDRWLCRLQVIGHLLSLKVIDLRDLQTIHFETIVTGRDQAVRAYLIYLNEVFVPITAVIHDHYEYFKRLYKAIEYDVDAYEGFDHCLFSSIEAKKRIASRP